MVTPSSALVDDEGYDIAETNIKALGLRLQWGKNVGKKYGYLAGKDEERIDDLHDMFADPQVKAIVCLRGGSGEPDCSINSIMSLSPVTPRFFWVIAILRRSIKLSIPKRD